MRRRAVDTPVNDPRLRRRACMPGRAPRAGQPRIARPAPAGELASCARGTEAASEGDTGPRFRRCTLSTETAAPPQPHL